METTGGVIQNGKMTIKVVLWMKNVQKIKSQRALIFKFTEGLNFYE